MKKHVLKWMLPVAIAFIQAVPSEEQPADKAALGKLLFFDPILSKDRTISCSSCHIPEFAFADTAVLSKGVKGRRGTRNSPSAMNLSLSRVFFWDGRAQSLEQQALQPISNPDEMDLPLPEAIRRLSKHKKYNSYFKNIFGKQPDSLSLAQAIAAFERTLETSESPFDEWKFSDNPRAVSEAVKNGFALFNGKAQCVKCHFGADLTNHDFRNIGLFDGKKLNDSGRAMVTKNPADIGKFKTSSLRNVALTAPYMHNGQFKTLEEVIEFYDNPSKKVPGNLYRDSILAKPLELSAGEKSDLKAFLESLTDKRFTRSAQ